ncbi:hypothetical protein [Catenulispora pinisilvae]|uniref:hypothetical protein n=1 Tax=Catenulispora pinisilvae TaxID=2705253 RepID=UPI001891D340|nr:hypothetical protein [Catenulispora pinisilvae]
MSRCPSCSSGHRLSARPPATSPATSAEAIGQRYLHAARALGRRPTQLHDPLARILLICPGVDPKAARRARMVLAEQREAADATDVGQLKESVLRKWKRRKDG